jgi:hypothetical protein
MAGGGNSQGAFFYYNWTLGTGSRSLADAGAGLQALINSLSPEILGRENEDGDELTPEQIKKLSDKLNEIMGQPSGQNHNESGEVRILLDMQK